MKDGAFKGPFDAGGFTRNVDAAELYLAQAAAKAMIDDHHNLAGLKKDTVVATAQCQIVQYLLVRAMIAFIETLPFPKQDLYEHLCRKETFGIGGGCWDVAPVFGYLLNRIHGGKVTRTGHSWDHAMLVTGTQWGEMLYLDATWRQGKDKQERSGRATDPREKLPMVRVSERKPTMGALDKAVAEALEQRAMAFPEEDLGTRS